MFKLDALSRPVFLTACYTRKDLSALRFSSDTFISHTRPYLQMQFLGCLFGVAVGDSLGCDLERMTAEAIRQHHGGQRRTEITGGNTNGYLQWEKGAVTDDTEMTLSLADSLIDDPYWNWRDLGARFVRLINQPGSQGYGSTTKTALETLMQQPAENNDLAVGSKAAWQRQHSSGNGSLMRCSPIALLYHKDAEALKKASLESCLLTHYSPKCQASTLAFNRLLASAMNHEVNITDKGSKLACYNKIADEISLLSAETAEVIRHAPFKTEEELKFTSHQDPHHCSDTLESLQRAFWAFYHYTDFEEAVTTVVNLGGDTDTNASITGALFGTAFGLGAIPNRWIDALQNEEAVRESANRLYRVFKQRYGASNL